MVVILLNLSHLHETADGEGEGKNDGSDFVVGARLKHGDHRGRCYDHNFLRFLTIFGEKNWRFSQKPML
jgi:hypothetical protein